ncbi:MAG: Mur ligase family protein [Candidatus Magasanikbacteria bacterium]|nr:Mur ligase family protein [Candidatus Magasanikbacteria bacterium]
MKKLLQLKLRILAKLILAKYKPEVIGITGSVGKTSTKEAIYTVLSKKFNVQKNIKNYNNEIGLPLSVIGAESGGRSLLKWTVVFVKAWSLILRRDKNYPEILILEMGIDRPGDMKYLTDIVKCKIGVVTTIGTVHAEYFESIDSIQKEKGELIKTILQGGWSIINYDDERTRKMTELSKAKVLTYGLDKKAMVRADEINYSFQNNEINGLSFKLFYNGSVMPVALPNIMSKAAAYSALVGAAVGLAYDMNLIDIGLALREMKSPLGRMNLIDGVKGTIIIDDTYNAEPKSTAMAIETVKVIPINDDAKKYAVLGDMLELGQYSEEGHQKIGELVFKSGIDYLIAVGERSQDIVRGAEAAGMNSDKIFHFDNSSEAGRFIQDRIETGDLILVKGSQGMRMEKIVKEIMANPIKAEELLVRQGEEWE